MKVWWNKALSWGAGWRFKFSLCSVGLSMDCISLGTTEKDITKGCIDLLLETEWRKSLDSAEPCCFSSLTDTWWLNPNRLHSNQTWAVCAIKLSPGFATQLTLRDTNTNSRLSRVRNSELKQNLAVYSCSKTLMGIHFQVFTPVFKNSIHLLWVSMWRRKSECLEVEAKSPRGLTGLKSIWANFSLHTNALIEVPILKTINIMW